MRLSKSSRHVQACSGRSCSHLRAAAKLTASVAIAATGSTAGVVITSLASRPTVAGAATLWDQGTVWALSGVITVWYQYQTYADGFGYTVNIADTWEAGDAVHFQNYKFQTSETGDYIHYDLLNQDYWSGTTGSDGTGNPDDLFGVTGTADNSTGNTLEWAGGRTGSGCGTWFGGAHFAPGFSGETPCTETNWSTSGHRYSNPQVNISSGVRSTNGGSWSGGSPAVGVHVMSGRH